MNGALPPWVLQVFGLAIIATFVIVKITANVESVPLVSVGVTLATIGGAQSAGRALKRAFFKGEDPE